MISFFGVTSASTANADEATGRDLVAQAEAADRAGDLAQAEALLRQAIEAWSWSYAAFRLADVLARGNQVVEAAQWLDRVENGDYGPIAGDAAAAFRRRAVEIRAKLAKLSLSWTGSDSASVSLDDRLVLQVDGQTAELTTNPGTRRLRLEAPGRLDIERSLELAPGANVSLRVQFENPAPETEAPPSRRWWIAGLVAGLVAVAAGVTVAVVLTGGSDARPPVDVPTK